MASVIYTNRAIEDVDRLADFLIATDPPAAIETIPLIISAAAALADHPLLGGRAEAGGENRELVISRGKTGYVALYRFDRDSDVVLIRAIRHQREIDYDGD